MSATGLRLLLLVAIFLWLAGIAETAPLPKDSAKENGMAMTSDAALAKGPRLPLWIWAAGTHSAHNSPESPLVAIGQLPVGLNLKPARIDDDLGRWHQSLPYLKAGEFLDDFRLSNVALFPAREDATTVLVLSGPAVNSGEFWGPTRLVRQDSTFTVLLESWTDNGARLRNVPGRSYYVVSLGALKAGDYQLRFVWRKQFQDRQKGEPYYRIHSWRASQVALQVTARDTAAPKVPSLTEKDFTIVDLAAAVRPPAMQRPVYWHQQLEMGGNLNGVPAPGLRVGTFDLPKWLAAKPANLGDVPRLELPKGGRPTYAVILGPSLNTGEWMTLRDIEWQDRKCMVRVELWRDDEPRLQNLVRSPLLVVPLGPLQGLSGREYDIQVEWTFLRSPNNRGVYQPDALTAPGARKLADSLKERSRETFSVK